MSKQAKNRWIYVQRKGMNEGRDIPGLQVGNSRADAPRPQVRLKTELQLRNRFRVRPGGTVQHRRQRHMIQTRRSSRTTDAAIPDRLPKPADELARHFPNRVIRRLIRPSEIPLPRTQPTISRHSHQSTAVNATRQQSRAEKATG